MGSALSLFFKRQRWGGVGPGREEARIWTFHQLQTQRTRAAEKSGLGGGRQLFSEWDGHQSCSGGSGSCGEPMGKSWQ